MIRQRALPALVRQGIIQFANSACSASFFFKGKYLRYFSAAIAVMMLSSLAVQAATISYGNFGPVAGISFLDVKESSGTDPVPLYGPPDPFPVGLDFDPTSFVAVSSGGGGDVTDGQLNFTVMGTVLPRGPSVGINAITLNERGDYTLVGTGTAATQTLAGAIISAKVTQIDGLPVPPINLLPSNGSVGFNLVANPGAVQPWSLGLVLAVTPQLVSLGIPFQIGATKIEVEINNSLVAISEPASVAFIAKKDFVIGIIPRPGGEIPEPSTLILVGVAVALTGCVAKQRGRLAA